MLPVRRFLLPRLLRRRQRRPIPTPTPDEPSIASSGVVAVVVHPEAQNLRDEIHVLRCHLASLLDERLRLELDELPRIRHCYNAHFVQMERTLQMRILEVRERERIVELVALKLDRGQKVDDRALDLVLRTVRAEFGRIRARIHANQERPQREAAMPLRAEQVSGSDLSGPERAGGFATDEVQRLYRRLARRFHPDMASDDQHRRNMWDMLQRAHAANDVDLFRTLDAVAHSIGDYIPGDIPSLRQERRRLHRIHASEKERLNDIRGGELYGMRDRILENEFVTEHRNRLLAQVARLEEAIRQCDAYLSMVQKGQAGPPPEELRSAWASIVEGMYINRH